MPKKSTSAQKSKMNAICSVLKARYPSSECALEYDGEPWKLLVMGRLSAQCTDARVNIVCKDLFARYPTLSSLADAPLEDIEQIIKPCGLYKGKAKSIKESCTMLRDEYGGVLPDSMDELLRFSGVGRKIANLLLGDIYHKPAIVADTHCIRICGRLGFYPETQKDPYKVEMTLSKICEPQNQSELCHRLVFFGRDICSARSPKCEECPLCELCDHYNKK